MIYMVGVYIFLILSILSFCIPGFIEYTKCKDKPDTDLSLQETKDEEK